MLRKYYATITTKGGQKYKFEWACSHSALAKADHVADLFMNYSHYVVKEKNDTCLVVPRTAVDSFSLKEDRDDNGDMY